MHKWLIIKLLIVYHIMKNIVSLQIKYDKKDKKYNTSWSFYEFDHIITYLA